MRIVLRLIPLALMAAITVVGSRSEPTSTLQPAAALPQGSGGCNSYDTVEDDCVFGEIPDQCRSSYAITGAFQSGSGLNQTQPQTVPCPTCNESISNVPTATSNPACCDQDNDGFNRTGCGAQLDCNDNNANIHPNASEVCDGVDNNCNGQIDEGFDQDGDGYKTCQGDCNDNDSSIYPGASEVCDDGPDNNCDGYADCNDTNCNTAPNCEIGPDGCTLLQRQACESINHLCHNGLCYTPILIDTLGDGIRLTSGEAGVRFDLGGGVSHTIAWTRPNSDDAWLALDRNGNGTIDNGKELFGNVTDQPPSAEKHGFRALATFDTPQNGGNNDGKIDQQDRVFASLLLWRDTNHNGISEAGELLRMRDLGISAIECEYKLSERSDQHGNKFRYRAKVMDASNSRGGRWAWDVILKLAR